MEKFIVMNKKLCLGIFFFCFASFGLFAQAENLERRIIGTWIVEARWDSTSNLSIAGNIWTIRADGTFSVSGSGNWSGRWAITGNTIILVVGTTHHRSPSIFMTLDDRTLIFSGFAIFYRE